MDNLKICPPYQFLKSIEKFIQAIYTQNVDGLEEKAGINKELVTYTHGALKSECTCFGNKCKKSYTSEEIFSKIKLDDVAHAGQF